MTETALRMSWRRYLDQDKRWQPDGRPPVAIKDMDARWRYNAARWLERNAARLLSRYNVAEDVDILCGPMSLRGEMAALAVERGLEEEHERRYRNPEGWMRSRPLWCALVADLDEFPNVDSKPKISPEFADPRNHLSECPWANGHQDVPCTCRDNSPEWTI